MLLARLLSKIFNKNGIILIDSQGQKYICGKPNLKNPLTLKLLKKDLNWKLVLNPDLNFPEAYTRGEIEIENGSLIDFLNLAFENIGRKEINVYGYMAKKILHAWRYVTNYNLPSKSKKNVVDPEAILATYGADTARLFMLSDSPPERDIEWTEAGIEGAWRFIQKLWRIANTFHTDDHKVPTQRPKDFRPAAMQLRRHAHQTIVDVTKDIEGFRFNRAVAAVRQLANNIAAFQEKGASESWARREAIEVLVKLIGPMLPHLAEEIWQLLGYSPSITVAT